MRIVRFLSAGEIHLGKQVDDQLALRIEGDLFGATASPSTQLEIEKLLAPLVPTDILCIGLNYREHAAESKSAIPENPMLFIKAGNTLNNPFDPIPVPRRSSQIDYECELAVVIGKTAKNVSRERRAGLRVRLHRRQRRLVARLAARQGAGRRAVRAGQELRRVLPARTVPRHARRDPQPQRPADQDDCSTAR